MPNEAKIEEENECQHIYGMPTQEDEWVILTCQKCGYEDWENMLPED